MPEVDKDWVKAQLAGAKVRQNVGDAVLTLLDEWVSFELSDVAAEATIEAFAALARGHALNEERPGRFVPVQIGAQVTVGDTVRVRADAFSTKAGQVHNGRIGKVVAKRAGDIIVNSTDGKEPKLEGAHYPANKLELHIK